MAKIPVFPSTKQGPSHSDTHLTRMKRGRSKRAEKKPCLDQAAFAITPMIRPIPMRQSKDTAESCCGKSKRGGVGAGDAVAAG